LGVDCGARKLLLEAPDTRFASLSRLPLSASLRTKPARSSVHGRSSGERARYEAERARRQYDASNPRNRLVARSLERVWEDKLRQAERATLTRELAPQHPISLAAADRAQILSLGEDLPNCGMRRAWSSAARSFGLWCLKEVVLDQRPESGQVWIRIIWQDRLPSASTRSAQCEQLPPITPMSRLLKHGFAISSFARKIDREIARALNADGLLSAPGRPFSGGEGPFATQTLEYPTVKINRTEHNPRPWPDGTYSVQGAAEARSISTQTVFKWLQKDDYPATRSPRECLGKSTFRTRRSFELRTQVRRTTLSKKDRHHEVVGSPIVSCQRSIGICVARIVEARWWRSSMTSIRSRRCSGR